MVFGGCAICDFFGENIFTKDGENRSDFVILGGITKFGDEFVTKFVTKYLGNLYANFAYWTAIFPFSLPALKVQQLMGLMSSISVRTSLRGCQTCFREAKEYQEWICLRICTNYPSLLQPEKVRMRTVVVQEKKFSFVLPPLCTNRGDHLRSVPFRTV